ncbi:hypothetical protein [Sphingomonas sp.]|uniref:hypothetical protein n=1 Tax=Sphingomonas sp. TaxID=28214 RepID=UPI002D078062|nr:hypothetical protein [Sphingomonas sp.]HTG38106.1 hypothetical protein [Sphingomonas sp.]
MPPFILLLAAPLLIAAAPIEALDTPTFLALVTAIVGVVLLRGVLLRRHLRKRRGKPRPPESSDESGNDRP